MTGGFESVGMLLRKQTRLPIFAQLHPFGQNNARSSRLSMRHSFCCPPPALVFEVIFSRFANNGVKTHRRQHASSVRVVPYWIKLPEEIVTASSVEIFKLQLFPEVPLYLLPNLFHPVLSRPYVMLVMPLVACSSFTAHSTNKRDLIVKKCRLFEKIVTKFPHLCIGREKISDLPCCKRYIMDSYWTRASTLWTRFGN